MENIKRFRKNVVVIGSDGRYFSEPVFGRSFFLEEEVESDITTEVADYSAFPEVQTVVQSETARTITVAYRDGRVRVFTYEEVA